MDEYDEAVLFTLSLLESRLSRLEYVLGNKPASDEKPKTVTERIHKLEKALADLSTKTSLLDDASQLLSKHHDLLPTASTSTSTSDPSPLLTPSELATTIIDRAPSFATTASQLKALEDQQLPSTDGFTRLALLLPRLAEAEDVHLKQALRISELRRRNGLLVQRVKQVQYLGAGRCWAEWGGRLQEVGKGVGRREFVVRREREEGGVVE